MANEYVALEDLKATLDLTGSEYAADDLAQALESASRAVDATTGRRFWLDADANQVRYYSPWAADLLVIDDLVTLTWLKTDEGGDGVYETTWLTTDYILRPPNAVADGKPWTQIGVRRGGAQRFTTCYEESVEVRGRFGWAAVPSQVKTATTLIATRLVKRTREAPFGIAAAAGFETGAARISRTDPDVVSLLAPFGRRRMVH